jgi:hypothetical protein
MKTALLVIGLLVAVMGLIWAAQGAGIFPYPASSFMINESRWITIGLITALGGAALALFAWRV